MKVIKIRPEAPLKVVSVYGVADNDTAIDIAFEFGRQVGANEDLREWRPDFFFAIPPPADAVQVTGRGECSRDSNPISHVVSTMVRAIRATLRRQAMPTGRQAMPDPEATHSQDCGCDSCPCYLRGLETGEAEARDRIAAKGW